VLDPCNRCRRFVRENEPCPFCGDDSPRTRERFKQLGRVFIAASAAGTITITACSAYGMPAPPEGPYVNRDATPETDGSERDP
jgi:hypothetical protein